MIKPELRERFRNLKGMIWDLDNTLYRLDDDFSHHFSHITATAVIKAGAPLPFDHAVSMATESFRRHGYSGKVFIEDYGIERQYLHHEAGRLADVTIISPMSDLHELIAGINLRHALITHGSNHYALRTLEHLGLLDWFPPERVQGYEDFHFQSKADSPLAFTRALEHLECAGGEAVMVEDTVRNLRVPHEMGITTVWLTHGAPAPDAPGYVDLVCRDAVALLELVKTARL